MVPVGAMHRDLGVAEAVLFAQLEHAVALAAVAAASRYVGQCAASMPTGVMVSAFVLVARGVVARRGGGCG